MTTTQVTSTAAHRYCLRSMGQTEKKTNRRDIVPLHSCSSREAGSVNKGKQQPPPFRAIIQVNLHQPAPPVKNWRILLVQSFTASACMPLLMATSAR